MTIWLGQPFHFVLGFNRVLDITLFPTSVPIFTIAEVNTHKETFYRFLLTSKLALIESILALQHVQIVNEKYILLLLYKCTNLKVHSSVMLINTIVVLISVVLILAIANMAAFQFCFVGALFVLICCGPP